MTRLIDILRHKARTQPDDIALSIADADGRIVSNTPWSEFYSRIERVGSHLLQEFSPGQRLLLAFPQGIDFSVALFACHFAACIPVPVPLPNSKGAAKRLIGVMADSETDLILTNDEFAGPLQKQFPASRVISIDESLRMASIDLAAPRQVEDSDTALIQYTSGSVSDPKGVAITHENLLINLQMITDQREEEFASIVCWVPHFHDMGLISNIYVSAFLGTRLTLLGAGDFVRQPLSWLTAMSEARGTYASVPNFALKLCTRLAHKMKPGEIDLSCVKSIANSSEPTEWEATVAFEAAFAPFGLKPDAIVPNYGMAECTVLGTYYRRDQPSRFIDIDRAALARDRIMLSDDPIQAQRVMSCGRPALDARVIIVDAVSRERLEDGHVGEIWITGPHLAQGYLNKPDLTEEMFGQRPAGFEAGPAYLRSGDLGFLWQGELYVTGRLKDLIIIRGQNYYPRDIEVLAEDASSHVRGGRVVAFQAENSSNQIGLLAEVGPDFDYQTHAQHFISTFQRSLADHYGLTASPIVLLPKHALPRTTSGKIQRRDARRLYLDGKLNPLFEFHPLDGMRQNDAFAGFPKDGDPDRLTDWVLRTLQTVSKSAPVDLDSNLFDLGVDSLGMTHLLIDLEHVSGVSLLEAEFYQEPTAGKLVTMLSSAKAAQDPVLPKRPQNEPPKKKRKTLKDHVVAALRVNGPIVGNYNLPYGLGSQLQNLALATPGVSRVMSKHVRDRFDDFAEAQAIENTPWQRRQNGRINSWSTWRERRLARAETFDQFVTVEGREHIQAARDAGRGIIVGLLHTRMKGLPKFVPELAERPIGAVGNLSAERHEFYGMGELAYHIGAVSAKTTPSSRVAQLHNAHRLLRNGDSVFMFMDTYEGVGGITVPFLGRRRPIRPGMADLALDTDAVILLQQQWLQADGRVTLKFHAPLEPVGDTRSDQVLSLLLQQAALMEEMWRSNLGQMDEEAMRNQLKLPEAR